MAVKIKCPGCQQLRTFEESQRGEVAACSCGKKFRVPRKKAAPAKADASAAPQVTSEPAPKSKPATKSKPAPAAAADPQTTPGAAPDPFAFGGEADSPSSASRGSSRGRGSKKRGRSKSNSGTTLKLIGGLAAVLVCVGLVVVLWPGDKESETDANSDSVAAADADAPSGGDSDDDADATPTGDTLAQNEPDEDKYKDLFPNLDTAPEPEGSPPGDDDAPGMSARVDPKPNGNGGGNAAPAGPRANGWIGVADPSKTKVWTPAATPPSLPKPQGEYDAIFAEGSSRFVAIQIDPKGDSAAQVYELFDDDTPPKEVGEQIELGRLKPGSLRLSSDGQRLLGITRDTNIRLWSVPDGKLLYDDGWVPRPLWIGFSNTERFITIDGREVFWTIPDPGGAIGADLPAEAAGFGEHQIVSSPGGRFLVVPTRDGDAWGISVLETEKSFGAASLPLRLPQEGLKDVVGLTFDPSGKTLMGAFETKTGRLLLMRWDFTTGALSDQWIVPKNPTTLGRLKPYSGRPFEFVAGKKYVIYQGQTAFSFDNGRFANWVLDSGTLTTLGPVRIGTPKVWTSLAAGEGDVLTGINVNADDLEGAVLILETGSPGLVTE